MKKLLTIILTITVLTLAAVFNWHGEPAQAANGDDLSKPMTEGTDLSVNCTIGFNCGQIAYFALSPLPDSVRLWTMNPDGTNRRGILELELGGITASDLTYSPDNRKLIFSDGPGTNGFFSNIFSINADGTGLTNLTPDSCISKEPVFSPDGSKIVFLKNCGPFQLNQKAFIMNADGSNQRRVTTHPIVNSDVTGDEDLSVGFSPDGNQIIFASNKSSALDTQIYLSSLDGMTVTALTDLDDDGRINKEPQFMSDGRIVFLSSREQPNAILNDVYVMAGDGTNQQRLTNIGGEKISIIPSPDASRVAFINDRIPGEFSDPTQLHIVNANGTNLVTFNPNSTRFARFPKFSPDGTKIGFVLRPNSSSDGNFVTAHIADLDGSNQIDLSDPNADIEFEAFGRPDIDGDGIPDGADNCPLAVNSYRVAFSNGLYIYAMNEDGSVRTQLTFGPTTYRENEPEFNRAGSRIVFQSNRTNNRNEIYSMNPDGTDIRQLTNIAGGNQSPSYSPDGSKIVFGSRRTQPGNQGTNDLYVMNADGSNQVGLGIRGTFATQDPKFNHDGTRIVYFAGRLTGPTSNTQDIYAINSDGTNETRLTTAAGVDNQPAFSPDGSKIAFVSFRGGDTDGEIYVMNSDGTNQTRLTNDTREDRFPTFTPDGTRITFGNRVDGHLSTINVDGTGLVRLTTGGNFFYDYPSYTKQPDADGDGTGDVCDSDFSVNTPTGTNVAVQAPSADVTFSNVSQAGTTSFTPIAPNQNDLPTGYTLCPDCPAYEITTTANYTPPIEVCLGVPASVTESLFLRMRLLHGENGVLVDRTTNRITDGNGQRFVCGSVNSLSPFILASNAAPTAANASVSGRVFANGRGVAKALVSLNNAATGETRTVLTNAFGYYHFEEVGVGNDYVISVRHKQHQFNPRFITVQEDLTEVDFSANEK